MDVLKYNSNKFLTIIDAFSKYAQVYPIETSQAIEITQSLLKFFSHHNTPELIVVDNGAEFDNSIFREFLAVHKVEIHFCSPHNPASNGMIERFHSTFLEHLCLLNNREEFKKDPLRLKVLFAVIAYNNSLHSATKMVPMDVINGNADNVTDIDIDVELLNHYMQEHRQKLINELVNKNLQTNKERTIGYHNRNREDVPDLPEKVFVRSNFRSKERNRFKKHTVKTSNKVRKTFEPTIDHKKTGRKYKKLHIANVKRPTKTN